MVAAGKMKQIDEYHFAQQLTPEQMDYAWANGWRHFGIYFFRYAKIQTPQGLSHVTPLRINLANFSLSTSQKRVSKKNQDLVVKIRDAFIDEAKEALFDRHKTRFAENVPNSIHDFFSPYPAEIPCATKEICLFQNDELIAASFLDLGQNSASSVYSIYEPAAAKRSLGVYLILLSIEYSHQHHKRYYYPGYAYREPSHYDYKKKFTGIESYDWSDWKTAAQAEL